MKKFEFKLGSVLQLRERVEAEAQQHHAAAGRRLEALLAELAEAEEEHKRIAEQLENMQKSTFRPAERDMVWNSLKYQKDLCGRLQQKADFAVKDLAEKREKLLEAQSEKEAMVKLQEKEQQDYNRTAQQQESAMIDDIVNARHSANQKNGGGNAR
jgi:flagellar FliJ protein